MGTIIIILILLVIILTAVKGTLKRILHGSACCGEREAPATQTTFLAAQKDSES